MRDDTKQPVETTSPAWSVQRTTRCAFTLIEMLVVIGIIGLVVGLSFPVIRSITADTDLAMGVNTVSMSVTTARAYAVQNRDFAELTRNDFTGNGPFADAPGFDANDFEQGLPIRFSGFAALFTPSGEVRLVENTAKAKDRQRRPLERLFTPRQPGSQAADFNDVIASTDGEAPARHLNGFADIEIDAVRLPSTAGLAGIYRTRDQQWSADPNGPPMLIPPPFAVWFDRNGYHVVGDEPHHFVFYDGKRETDEQTDGRYDIDSGRPSDYDPAEYDRGSGRFDPDQWNRELNRSFLPFERIETVAGIYVYSKSRFADAVAAGRIEDWTRMNRSANTGRWEWMRENGRMIVFSRQTGTVVRSVAQSR